MPSTRRRHRKQHGGAMYTFTKEFYVTLRQYNEELETFNTYVDLSELDDATLAPLAASIVEQLEKYADILKRAPEFPSPIPYPHGDPIAGLIRSFKIRAPDVDDDDVRETIDDIVKYVSNITYRHIDGNKFEVTFDITLPDSNNGEPNLGFSNDDKEVQRDNIFDLLINYVEHMDFSDITYQIADPDIVGIDNYWAVVASENEIDYGRFAGPYFEEDEEDGNDDGFEANDLLIGAQDAGIILKPPIEQANAISLAPFEYNENVIIIREAGFDHIYKRDGLLAFFANRIAMGLPIINPTTNTHIINPGNPLPDPAIFANGIVFKTGRIAAAPEEPQLGGRRRTRKQKSKRRHRSRRRGLKSRRQYA